MKGSGNVEPYSYDCAMPMEGEETVHYPSTYMNHVPKAALKGLTVGDEIRVVITGKVTEIASRESGNGDNNNSFDIEMHNIETYTKSEDVPDEWADMMDAD